MFSKPLKISEIAFSHLVISHLWGLEPRICQVCMQVLLAGNDHAAHKTADQNLSSVLVQGRCAGFRDGIASSRMGMDLSDVMEDHLAF